MTGGTVSRGQNGPTTVTAAMWLLVLVVVSGIWVAGLLVPYYVNDLDELSLEEVASGAHDPKGLWPYAREHTSVGLLQGAVLLLALPFTPLLGLGSTLAGAALLAGGRSSLSRTTRALIISILVVAVTMVALSLSPFGLALGSWFLD